MQPATTLRQHPQAANSLHTTPQPRRLQSKQTGHILYSSTQHTGCPRNTQRTHRTRNRQHTGCPRNTQHTHRTRNTQHTGCPRNTQHTGCTALDSHSTHGACTRNTQRNPLPNPSPNHPLEPELKHLLVPAPAELLLTTLTNSTPSISREPRPLYLPQASVSLLPASPLPLATSLAATPAAIHTNLSNPQPFTNPRSLPSKRSTNPPQHHLPAAPPPAAPPLLRPLATSCLELSVPPRSSRNSHSSRKHMPSQPPRAPQPRNSAAVSLLSLSFAHSAHALSCNLTRASQLNCLMSCTESSAAENLTITQLLSNSYLDR